MSAAVRFLPWVRRGMAGAIDTVDTLGDGVPGRATLPVEVTVEQAPGAGAPDGDGPPEQSHIRPDVALYGPGDVIGVDRSEIVRTSPPPFATGVEPTFFPLVEFRSADLPWRFSPAAADQRGRLRPWLCLVVVPAVSDAEPRAGRDGRPPSVTLDVAELPDLAESWAWAHAQAVVEEPGADLAEVLADRGGEVVSRLLCPRRLVPDTTYRAFLVPAFAAGRAAGLGEAVDAEAELAPAWRGDAEDRITLPVYHHWEFSTGAAGDFESLVQQLRPRPLPDGVGTREVRIAASDAGLPDAGVLRFGGALRPPGSADDAGDVPEELRAAFRTVLDRSTTVRPHDPDGRDPDPLVGPPVYGTWQASHRGGSEADAPPVWLGTLNLDPRHRAAAAWGTLVVQDRQRELMAAAWEQVGPIREANQLLRQAELARQAGRGVRSRRVARLPTDEVFTVTGLVHPSVRLSPETVEARTRRSRLPRAAVSGAFRRTTRARGPIGRRVRRGDGDDGDSPATGDGEEPSFVGGLADGSLTASPPRSNPPVLDVSEHVLTAAQIQQADGSSDVAAEERPDGFEEALDDDRDHLEHVLGITAPEPGPPLPLDDVTPTLLDRLDPDATAATRARSRVLGRPIRPLDPLEPLSAAPVFDRAMYTALADLSGDALLPGLAQVPADTVALLEVDPSFIEAFLVGLNHEMSRELLWREFPTDQRGTYFRRFWDHHGGDPRDRSRLIHDWDPHGDLGTNHPDAAAAGRLVLLVRGELFRRYPDAVVSVVRARRLDDGRRGLGDVEQLPLFEGGLEPDVTFVGFDLTVAEARSGPDDPGWFVVIQEQPADLRFGLDLPARGDDPGAPPSWGRVTWAHASADPIPHHAPVGGPLDGVTLDGIEWGRNAAHMARITLEPPLRLAIHADDLLPSEDD